MDDLQLLTVTPGFLAVRKPVGMPSQPDPSGAPDALTCAASLLPAAERGTLYPVHRLDRTVGGVLLLARERGAAASLSALFAEHRLTKVYFAVALGEVAETTYRDLLYKDALAARARVATAHRPDAREAVTAVFPLAAAPVGGISATLLRVTPESGRFHQIRAQLAAHGHPLLGDRKYGAPAGVCRTPALFSARLAFTYRGRAFDIRALPDTTAEPWQSFSSVFEKGDIL